MVMSFVIGYVDRIFQDVSCFPFPHFSFLNHDFELIIVDFDLSLPVGGEF